MVSRIEGNGLAIGDSHVRFRHPVKKYLETTEAIVVLLDVPVSEHDNTNVIGIDYAGQQLWEIEPVTENADRDVPYTNIVERDGEIWALNWRGDEYCITPETGDVLKKEFRRF